MRWNEVRAVAVELMALTCSDCAPNNSSSFPAREQRMPPLDPDVLDLVPSDPALTAYDEQHAVTYLRLLDADAEGVDWREVARIVLRIDPDPRT
jgi:hypothetical protein